MNLITNVMRAALAAGLCGGGLASGAVPVAVDGETGEWPEGVHAAADAEFLYFRLPFGEIRPLLVDGRDVRIGLDLDEDPGTGLPESGNGLPRGADLTIELRDRAEWRDPWFFATVYDAGGRGTDLAFERAEPLAQPTYAGAEHELRLRRDAHPMLLEGGNASGVIVLEDAREVREGRERRRETVTVPVEMKLPLGQPLEPVDAELPDKPADAVRLVAHNVLWSNPEDEDPAPFARMYRALDPDIYLIQEWGRGPWSEDYELRLEAWFTQHVDPGRAWDVVRNDGWGVAIVTHHPIVERGPRDLRAESLTRWDFPVRLAAAVVLTPTGPMAVGSIHLKCCGSLDTEEDQRRIDEMRAIQPVMAGLGEVAMSYAERAGEPPMVVLGGDYNHNGDALVVQTGLRGLDLDGSSLELAYTPVLGSRARYSFGGPAYGHRRSFLDYIAYSDAGAEAVNAFVLDTEILSESSLNRMGLERSDSSAADHLPVVVDLRPR